jgi:hypothetical protein
MRIRHRGPSLWQRLRSFLPRISIGKGFLP